MIEKLIVDSISEEANEEINRIIEEELNELHLRREIERIADKEGYVVEFSYGKYGVINYYRDRWVCLECSLQQCHDKLRELSGEE